MEKIQLINYQHNTNNYKIPFDKKNGQLMINATQMAKPFGKLVGDFLRLNQTKTYINVLKKRYGNTHITKNIVEVVKGNSGTRQQGTWMCEQLALKFAAWLSAEFEVWVYDKIQELLRTGKVELVTTKLNPLEEHKDHQVQKNNTKAVAHKAWISSNNGLKGRSDIVKYHSKSCKLHTGLTPKQVIKIGKDKGLKSVQRSSAKEVIRNVTPIIACVMSLTDNIIASSEEYSINDLENVHQNITVKSEGFFEALIENGIRPPELDQQ